MRLTIVGAKDRKVPLKKEHPVGELGWVECDKLDLLPNKIGFVSSEAAKDMIDVIGEEEVEWFHFHIRFTDESTLDEMLVTNCHYLGQAADGRFRFEYERLGPLSGFSRK